MKPVGALAVCVLVAGAVLAGCAAASSVRSVRALCATDPRLVGSWGSARFTQLGPATVSFAFDCECRYTARGFVLGREIEERGAYRAAGGTITTERESGGVTVMPSTAIV